MNTGLFGEGSLSLGYDAVEGQAGLQPRLVLKGKLIAKGYGIGAVVQLTADVTASNLAVGSHSLLGSTLSRPYLLNWVKQQYVQTNPLPSDENIWDTQLYLPLDPAVIEGLEERRQGRDFSLQIDTQVLMVDRGISIQTPSGESPVHYQVHPTMQWQDNLQITQAAWGAVLDRWERGTSIPLVVLFQRRDLGSGRVRSFAITGQLVRRSTVVTTRDRLPRAVRRLRYCGGSVRPSNRYLPTQGTETLHNGSTRSSTLYSDLRAPILTPTL